MCVRLKIKMFGCVCVLPKMLCNSLSSNDIKYPLHKPIKHSFNQDVLVLASYSKLPGSANTLKIKSLSNTSFWTKWTNMTGCPAQSLPEKVPHGTLGERLALADPLLQWLWKTTTSRRWPKVPTITKIRDIFLFLFCTLLYWVLSDIKREKTGFV